MQVFDDINVIDTTTGKAGSICSMFLGDNGARIIRIPVGSNSLADDPELATIHRGKELLNLDLDAQYDSFMNFVQKSDILIEDLLPSDPLQEKIGFEALRKNNPQLMH